MAGGLGPGVFRALTSPVRGSILRALLERPHTPAELARRLTTPESTVRHHLVVLVRAGLVDRRDDGRVWAYHALTEDGRAVVGRSWRGPLVAGGLGAANAAAGIGLLAAWRARLPPLPDPTSPTLPFPSPPDPWLAPLLAGGVILLATGLLLVTLAWRARATLRA